MEPVAKGKNSRNPESSLFILSCTCSGGFSRPACQEQITLMFPQLMMLPYCVCTWGPGTLCRILATCYHPQWCVLRLEAPWVPVWGSRRHQFEMWWLKSVRTQSDTEERLYRDKVILSLSFFSVTQGCIKFSSEHLAFSSGSKKPPHFNKSTCLWAPLWNSASSFPVWNNRNHWFCFSRGGWWNDETVKVAFMSGSGLLLLRVRDCETIRPDQRNTGIKCGRRVAKWAPIRRTREWFQRWDAMTSGRLSAPLLPLSHLTSTKDQHIDRGSAGRFVKQSLVTKLRPSNKP